MCTFELFACMYASIILVKDITFYDTKIIMFSVRRPSLSSNTFLGTGPRGRGGSKPGVAQIQTNQNDMNFFAHVEFPKKGFHFRVEPTWSSRYCPLEIQHNLLSN